MSLEDRFDIESPIHIGQVATAYPAKKIDKDLKVLLKVIHPQWAQDDELVERFEREGQTIASIDHPNVVKVLEFGKVDAIPFMALEWVEGGTLADRLMDGPLQQNDLHKIAKEILTGLKAVHDAGMVHRDLKPDNILLGADGHVRLADFSLAGFSGRSKMTEHGTVLGSPAYMAPELLDAAPATPASDLYSVGIILLEALTGSNPYQSSDPMISLGLVRQNKPPILTGRKSINEDLARLVDALLSRTEIERPQSAKEALNILIGGEALSFNLEITQKETTRQSSYKSFRSSYLLYILVAITGLVLVSLPWILRREIPVENEILQEGTETDLVNDSKDTDDLVVKADSEEIVLPDEEMITRGINGDDLGSVSKEEMNPEGVIPVDPINKIVQNGYIALVVRPWARVKVDDEEIGITPIGRIELSPGKHNINLINKSFPQFTKSVNIVSGRIDTLEIDLMSEYCRIEVSAIPWGYLWIDSDSIGLLPRKDPIWINPGRHRLRVNHPGISDWQDSINVNSGKSYAFKIDLKSGTMVAK